MIKSIAYFPLQTAKNSKTVLNLFLESCQSYGIRPCENSMDADAAVIWSVLWHGRMAGNEEVYNHYRSLGRPVICIDVGSLYRGTTWKIAVNNITGQGYYGHTENLDWNRPLRLGISLAASIGAKPEIIIVAQHRNSLQVQGLASIESWINDQVQQIRTVTDRPIVIRPHPRCPLDQSQLIKNLQIEYPTKLPNTYDSFDMHYDCHAVVNYNSGPGIQAAISGVRPIVDTTSLAWPVSTNIADIDQPYNINRDQWLVEICHTEYTETEIKKGTWLKRLEHSL